MQKLIISLVILSPLYASGIPIQQPNTPLLESSSEESLSYSMSSSDNATESSTCWTDDEETPYPLKRSPRFMDGQPVEPIDVGLDSDWMTSTESSYFHSSDLESDLGDLESYVADQQSASLDDTHINIRGKTIRLSVVEERLGLKLGSLEDLPRKTMDTLMLEPIVLRPTSNPFNLDDDLSLPKTAYRRESIFKMDFGEDLPVIYEVDED